MRHSPPTPKPLLLSKGKQGSPCRSKAKEPGGCRPYSKAALRLCLQRGCVVLPYGGVEPTGVSNLQRGKGARGCRPYGCAPVSNLCAYSCIEPMPPPYGYVRASLPLCRTYGCVVPVKGAGKHKAR